MHIHVYRARCPDCKEELLPTGKGKGTRKCKCGDWKLTRGGNWKKKNVRNGEQDGEEDVESDA